jgi:hypothetical protein
MGYSGAAGYRVEEEGGIPMRRWIFLALFFFPVAALAGGVVKVKVKKSSIYERPEFFSAVVTSVEYGDQMEMVDERKDWAYVKCRGQKGWIHKSGLSSTRIDLGTILVGGSSGQATYDEVALAGKGFTPEVEQGYRKSHGEMNYALVDQIERYNVGDRSLYEFIKQGGLKIAEVE